MVFNDDTNKKIIVEEGQEVKFDADDMLAIYIPRGTGNSLILDDIFNKIIYTERETVIMGNISREYLDRKSVAVTNVVRFNDEAITLTATLILNE